MNGIMSGEAEYCYIILQICFGQHKSIKQVCDFTNNYE